MKCGILGTQTKPKDAKDHNSNTHVTRHMSYTNQWFEFLVNINTVSTSGLILVHSKGVLKQYKSSKQDYERTHLYCPWLVDALAGVVGFPLVAFDDGVSTRSSETCGVKTPDEGLAAGEIAWLSSIVDELRDAERRDGFRCFPACPFAIGPASDFCRICDLRMSLRR